MKAGLRFILYFLLALIIVGGLYLFVNRNQLALDLQKSNNLEVVLPAVSKKIPKSKTIDTSVLKNPVINSLVNNVVNFNFDNICWRPSSFSQNNGATSSLTTNCSLGNGWPFVSKSK